MSAAPGFAPASPPLQGAPEDEEVPLTVAVGRRMAAVPMLDCLDTVPPFRAEVHVRWTQANPEEAAAMMASLDDWLAGSGSLTGTGSLVAAAHTRRMPRTWSGGTIDEPGAMSSDDVGRPPHDPHDPHDADPGPHGASDTCTVQFTVGELQLQPAFSAAPLLRAALQAVTEDALQLAAAAEAHEAARAALHAEGWLATAGVRPLVLHLEGCSCHSLSVVVVDDRVGHIGQQVLQVGAVVGAMFYPPALLFTHRHCCLTTGSGLVSLVLFFNCVGTSFQQVLFQNTELTMLQETCIHVPDTAESSTTERDELWSTARLRAARAVTTTNVGVQLAVQVLYLNSAMDSVDRMVEEWPATLAVQHSPAVKRVVITAENPLEVTLTPMALRCVWHTRDWLHTYNVSAVRLGMLSPLRACFSRHSSPRLCGLRAEAM